jgi:HTH-type transcriptional regulator / antitoxin HigA
MITNERQYRITKSQAERFRAALRDFNEIDLVKQGVDPVIIAAQRASIEQQLTELEKDIAHYESLRSGRVKRLFPSKITDIGENLIEARISQGLSQKSLAERLGMKEQQVQRYEQERYLSANLIRVAEVAEALQLDLFAFFEAREDTLLDKIVPNLKGRIGFDQTKLPVKEMKRRGWLKQIRLPATMESATDEDLATAFVSQAFDSQPAPSLHKQNVRMGSERDPYALLAWKAQVLHKAWRARASLQLGHEPLDAHAIKRLVTLSAVSDGPLRAVDALREHGVILVFEWHLPSTHLDGAAMLLNGEVPVIGLTLRYDRLDNFWFVLLHEVGHVILHRERGLREGFFDEDQAALENTIETEADEFAQSAFIPKEVWKRSFVRFTASSEQVYRFAAERKVGVAIVAGRIRRERDDYQLFSELVGSGTVRKLLTGAGYWES